MINEWSPEAWEAYCTANPARRIKMERDRQLASELLGSRGNARLLEAGCGYGRLTPTLLQSGRVVVMDRELKMVRAVCKGLGRRLSGVVSNIEKLSVRPGAFDAVVCIGVLMHLRDPLKATEELAQTVKPGGKLILSWNNSWSPWAWLLAGWARRPGALPQRFLSRQRLLRKLQQLGFSIRIVRGDALIPLAASIPGIQRSLWPLWLARMAVRIERWPGARRLLAAQGYELFALAQRRAEPLCSS